MQQARRVQFSLEYDEHLANKDLNEKGGLPAWLETHSPVRTAGIILNRNGILYSLCRGRA